MTITFVPTAKLDNVLNVWRALVFERVEGLEKQIEHPVEGGYATRADAIRRARAGAWLLAEKKRYLCSCVVLDVF